MESFLNLVRSNNMVQAIVCIAFGLFLMIYPSITVGGIILLFGVSMAFMGLGSIASYFRRRGTPYRSSGTLMAGIFYLIVAVIAFVFPHVLAGFFSVLLGLVLVLCAIVNAVQALGMRRYGGNVWIAVLVVSLLVGIGGVLIVVNPFGATMAFVLLLGGVVLLNGMMGLFIEWYARDTEKKDVPVPARGGRR